MELWIRSQDRCYLQEMTGFKDNGTSIWGYSYTDTGILLGTYKSKERALEVLDEIQNHISNINDKENGNEYYPIFIMPKE